MKRDNYIPTENARICNKHFLSSDYEMPKDSVMENPKMRLKKGAVPSLFPWTEETTSIVYHKRKPVKNRLMLEKSLHLSSRPIQCGFLEETVTTEIDEVKVSPMDTMTLSKQKGEMIQKRDASTMTTTLSSFCIENLQSELKKDELHFYTGFDSYDHFLLVFNILGPAVDNLLYYPTRRPMKIRMLTPMNEFLLTIVKLRRNMINKELAFKFGISEPLVNRIFITWINFLFCQFEEIKLWTPSKGAEDLESKVRKCASAVIIECTKIKIDPSKNPELLVTCSTYKPGDTLRVLVGISSTGGVSFVSEVYGGSISDKCLFEKCGLSDLLDKNDVVFVPEDASANSTELSKKNAGQLVPKHLHSKSTLPNKIKIKRVIGLAKTYNILKYLSSNSFPLARRIIFVCFMLSNFRHYIMHDEIIS